MNKVEKQMHRDKLLSQILELVKQLQEEVKELKEALKERE